MQLIFEDKLRRTIRGREEIKFQSFSSYHLIEVVARAKSEKQLGQNVTDDEDLVLWFEKDKTFPSLDSRSLINSPAAFSGGRLHNLSKVVYFLFFLKGGSANHFYSARSFIKPYWATEDRFTVQIGATRFFKL